MIPEGYELVESLDRVGDGEPALVTRSRWRAERRARRLNAARYAATYRWEVVCQANPRSPLPRRWAVVAMQNYLKERADE